MLIPIPDDWDGESWQCVQISWPQSDKWLAILAGFLITPMRGRFWDERTGSIKDTQQIGIEIDARNNPFNSCEGEPIVIDNGAYSRLIEAMEVDFIMSLCGYNPKAFKIEDGKLWVRDFCGEWNMIGALDGTPDLPPGDIIPDPPPEGLQETTVCAQSTKLANFVWGIVNQAWIQIGIPEIVDIYDFVSDMRDFFPGVDLAYDNLMEMYFQMIAIDTAGLENECRDVQIIQVLKCYYAQVIKGNATGMTHDEYSDCIGATGDALSDFYGDSKFYGLGRGIRVIWQEAIRSIGEKDVQKLTYNAQPSPDDDCSCPDDPDPLDPVTGGWYLGALHTLSGVPVPYDEGEPYPLNEWGYPFGKMNAPNGVYGAAFRVTIESGSVNRVKRANDDGTAPVGTHDVFMTNNNSDYLDTGQWYYQMSDTVADLLYAAYGVTGATLSDAGGDFSSTVNSPVAAQNQVVALALALQETASPATVGFELRWLYNAEDDSHS